MFDVFYSGKKPNLFAHEQAVDTIEQAQQQSRTRFFWFVNYLSDYTGFDFLWEPVPWQAHQRHAWPSQHQTDSGTYLVPTAGYTDTNYHTDVVLQRINNEDSWKIHEAIDQESWDWSWHPDPAEPPYIYVFGNQWSFAEYKASVEYIVPGATERKYMDLKTTRLPQPQLFAHNLAVSKFDYSWEPNPFDPPYVYVFGNQWNPGVLEPTIVYTVPGATERKYVDDIVATVASSPVDFDVLHDVAEFDYSWRPDPTDPDYIYVFGNEWHTAEIMPTVEYCVGSASERKYVDYPRAKLPVRQDNKWYTVEDCNWDYSWIPDPGDPPYIYMFGNQHWSAEIMPTVTYTVPGATERKYMDYPRAQLLTTHLHWDNISHCNYEFDYSWRPDPGEPPMIYVFGNQHWPAEKMPVLRYCSEPVDEGLPVKYMDYPRATLLPNKEMWILPEGVREEQVDFSWVPDPGEPPYIYQFATQHQKTGGPQYRVPGASEVKYVDMMQAKVNREAAPIFEIDHLDGNAGKIPNTTKLIRYFDNYRDTLIRLAKNLQGKHEHVWVCSSICDYSNFDFSWHPEYWQSTMLHVFASGEEKFGDTFYMHVPTFAERAEKKQLLEWYSLNYVRQKSVARRPMPVIKHEYDSQVDAIKNLEFVGPLGLFVNGPAQLSIPVVPLWHKKTKTIVPLSSGASSVIVPRTAIPYIKNQLYDYPYIDKTKRTGLDDLCDVVFISNGESVAEDNWQNLLTLCPRAKRSEGVDGREAAYKTAARLSNTAWFFAVFAKTEVLSNFKFDFQPDRMQEPKHYIFYSRNPLNSLEYGAMNINLYNKQLTVDTVPGLDFTLSAEHTVVPIVASISRFNTDPWITWRSAFREVLKLKREVDLGAGVEIQYRLKVWCEHAVGDNAEYCLQGSKDALEYYTKVNGDYDALCLSFDWAWLQEYYYLKYKRKIWLEFL